MKKKSAILFLSLVFSLSFMTSAFADVDYWYKGSGASYKFKKEGTSSYNDSTNEWATITAHAYYSSGSLARERVRTFSRVGAVKAQYGSDAIVQIDYAKAALKDNDTRGYLWISDIRPNEQTETTIPSFLYNLKALLPYGALADVFVNNIDGGIDHWYSAYDDNARLMAYRDYGLKASVVDMHMDISHSEADEHSDYHYDVDGISKGITGEFLFDFGDANDYQLRAWGQVRYDVYTDNGNGSRFYVKSAYPTVNHIIN